MSEPEPVPEKLLIFERIDKLEKTMLEVIPFIEKFTKIIPVVEKQSGFLERLFKKQKLEPLDIDKNGIIDEKEKQIFDYYNNSMERMQTHYIWGRVIDLVFTLALVLLSVFVL